MNPVLVGEEVTLQVSQSGNTLRAELAVDSGICVSLTLRPSTNDKTSGTALQPAPADPHMPSVPAALELDEMRHQAGAVGFAVASDEFVARFPALCGALGATQVAALACTSRLVGMVCPGLHSIFAGADLTLVSNPPTQTHLEYRALDPDPRTRIVSLAVNGSGIAGTVDAFARLPPVQQPKAGVLLGLLDPTKTANTLSLVVGGSRGIGEVAAKIVAGSGGRVLISYAQGRDDAERVAADIQRAGGHASVCALDVRRPLGPQLRSIGVMPTHAYHFATPQIFGKRTKVFDQAIFDNYCRFYVSAFWELCQFLAESQGNGRLFYPSSVAVAERPRNMTEYAMAKAAGEQLCADIGRSMPGLGVVMRRLPRILTDQTATIAKAASQDVIEAILPAVREMLDAPGPAR
jgi:NAD(P)-dependent dehydrogenase (short-subunit alcohol dehydrogenase family)